MVTNKALVLNKRGHQHPPLLFFCSKQICFIKIQVCSRRVGLQSPGNVITVRFLPQDEDWCTTLQSGQKSDKERDFSENERQTLLGLRLGAHEKLQNPPKKLASNDAEDLLCSLFLYFLSFFFCFVFLLRVCVCCVHF